MNKLLDFNVYKEHILNLNEKIGMDAENTEIVLSICKDICESPELSEEFLQVQEEYFKGFGVDNETIGAVAEKRGYHKHRFALPYCEMYTLKTLEIYKQHDYDIDEVYYNSMKDIVIWGNVCKAEHGTFGIANYGWVACQIRVQMFRLGRLQFHRIGYPHDWPEFTVAGIKLKPGDPIINIHIPEGDALTREKRLEAYKMAYHFFSQTGHAVFMCDSWLLYPGLNDFLPEKSNILDFMRDFVEVKHSEKPALTFGDLWRIFGRLDSYEPENLPRNTSVQRAFAKRIEEGGNLGCGSCVFAFDGENILH